MLILIIDEKVAGSETVQELCKERPGVVVHTSPEQRRGSRQDGAPAHSAGGASNVVAFRAPGGDAATVTVGESLTEIVEDVEARLVHEAMVRTGHNQIRASELLQITRGALQYKLKKYARIGSEAA